jgi:hypothetical protein
MEPQEPTPRRQKIFTCYIPGTILFYALPGNLLDCRKQGQSAELVVVQVLTRLAEKYAERPFSYLWMEGASQPALEEALGVGG